MNLDPTVSPWIGIFASTGVCLWMAAIGAPLAKAVFGERPRPVWPFYAPALGVVAVLLTTNLSAYVIPGAPSAWFGLLAPSALAAFVAWRSSPLRPPPPFSDRARTALASLVLLLASAGAYLVLFANRTQVRHGDESWHFGLALRMARGVFPPVTPYGPDAGIGYHYGPNLLAASIVNIAAVPAWTALAVLMSFLVVGLALAAVGYAWDLGAPLPVAVGTGVAVGLFSGSVNIGHPIDTQASGPTVSLTRLSGAWAEVNSNAASPWLQIPQRALAVAYVVLIAAALQAGVARRHLVVVTCAAGIAALAEAAVMLFSSAGLALVGALRLIRLSGHGRFVWAFGLVVAALLVALAGGPVSDALFGRGGTVGSVRIAFEPTDADALLFDLTRPGLVQLGTIPVIAIGASIAVVRRNIGLGFLTAAAAFGLVESIFLQSQIPQNDGRILRSAMAIAMLAALSGVGWLASGLVGWRRASAVLVIILLVVLPTVLPRAVTTGRQSSAGFAVGLPVADSPGFPFVGQTRIHGELEADWDFYAWVARTLPNDARLLTTHPAPIVATTGIPAPTSGRSPQALAPFATSVYHDAIRFLHRDDLAEMGITHLHVTDALAEALAPGARRLLDDSRHFKLLADLRSVSGRRHRIFKVMPGAGVPEPHESSFRALRRFVASDAPVFLIGGLTAFQRAMLLYSLVDQDELRASHRFFNRMTQFPRYQPASEIPSQGVVALPEYMEPSMLGLAHEDAVWIGYGIRVYDLAAAWSAVWRIGPDLTPLPARLQSVCEAARSQPLTLKLLGEPGDVVVAGTIDPTLRGMPESFDLGVGTCENLAFAAHGAVAPFAQVRPQRPDAGTPPATDSAGLGIDGGVDGGRLVINLWYRNPHHLSMTSGTEFRLYELGAMAFTPVDPDPVASIRWWPGPLVLAPDRQMARIEFDLERLAINGDRGGGSAESLAPDGRYLLTLNLAGKDTRTVYAEVSHQIPLAHITTQGGRMSAEVFSAIVTVRPPRPGDVNRWVEHNPKVGWTIDLTPWPEEPEASP